MESGEVDVVAGGKNSETVVTTLRAGDYFSHLSHQVPACSLRARTRVRLLGIDRNAAEALGAVRPDLTTLLEHNTNSAPQLRCV